MTFQVQDNRSSTQNQRPLPSSLLDGQTAINYNNNSPGLFFRTSTGALAKAGPAAIGATAPTATGWTEYGVGELWLDTTTNRLKIWDGTAWITVVGAAVTVTSFVPPNSPVGLASGAVWNNGGTLTIVS